MKITTLEAASDAMIAAVVAEQNALAAMRAANAKTEAAHALWIDLNRRTLAAKVAAREAHKAALAAGKATAKAKAILHDTSTAYAAAFAASITPAA